MASDGPSLGTRIKRARERMRLSQGKPMSQADLAKAIGVSRAAVNSWENDRAVPRDAIGALEQILQVDLTSAPGQIEPRDEYEAELLSLKDLAPGTAERLIEMYRARAEPPRRTG